MKVSFEVNPSLETESDLADIMADLLVLGKFRNMEMSALASFDARTNGLASETLDEEGFFGEEEQYVVFEPGVLQRRVMFAGLGRSQDYGCKVVAHVAQVAVLKARLHGCKRIAIPFPPKRSTGGLSLKMQAHFIREAAQAAADEDRSDDEIIVEFVCAKKGSAARELQKGIDMPVAGVCCCKQKSVSEKCRAS